MEKNLLIANDHGGYVLKLKVKEHLAEKGLCCHDFGSHSVQIVRYPYYAAKVAQAISRGEAERGILICSTGIGMSIVANRYKGVRASVCTGVSAARLTRAHNDSNILCLGGKIVGDFAALDIVDAWLATEYIGGRHAISLGLLTEAENSLCVASEWRPSNPDL